MGAVNRANQRRPSGYVSVSGTMTIGGAARTPNAARPTQVVVTFESDSSDSQNRQIQVSVSPNQTDAFVTIASSRNHPDVSGLGVGIDDIKRFSHTFEVPANGRYQFAQTGAGATGIAEHVEQYL